MLDYATVKQREQIFGVIDWASKTKLLHSPLCLLALLLSLLAVNFIFALLFLD